MHIIPMDENFMKKIIFQIFIFIVGAVSTKFQHSINGKHIMSEIFNRSVLVQGQNARLFDLLRSTSFIQSLSFISTKSK